MNFLEHLYDHHVLAVFITSMLPVLELRGAIPLGVSLGMPHLSAFAVAFIGNLIPVPFIIIFIRRIFSWLKKNLPFLGGLVNRLEQRAESKRDFIHKWQLLGLFILVAIPLPGTGAWTGALVAAIFDLRLKHAFPVIAAGVFAAGIIMLIITYGVTGILG